MNDNPKELFTCTALVRKAANKISDMSGLSKLFKFSANSTHKVPTVAVAATATSSVSPNCRYIAHQKYLRSRRLVTRTDVRARMSVWSRLFNWCRGGRKLQADSETIFTMRP